MWECRELGQEGENLSGNVKNEKNQSGNVENGAGKHGIRAELPGSQVKMQFKEHK